MANRGPVLLCFDGSEAAATAIRQAAAVLGPRAAVVLTAWEPLEVWEPYDPGAVLSAGAAKLASHALGLDEIAEQLGREKLERGVELAGEVGFLGEGRLARGRAWQAICDVAEELEPAVIVLGARGLSRVQSMLLGSVSASVAVHARAPVLIVRADAGEDDE